MLSLKPLKGAKVLQGAKLQLTLGGTNSSIWHFSDSTAAAKFFDYRGDSAMRNDDEDDY
jgi:hypothetical protein